MVPAQGDGIDLSAGIYLYNHGLGTTLSWEVQACKEGYLPIRSTLCVELTFSLVVSSDAVSWYHIYSILVVPVGCRVPFGMQGAPR